MSPSPDSSTRSPRDAFLSSVRVAYGVGFLFVCFATFIAWKYLPARAAVFPGQDEHDDELDARGGRDDRHRGLRLTDGDR